MSAVAEVLLKGPCYFCDECGSLIRVPDELIKQDTVTKSDEDGEYDVVEATFTCPECKQESVAYEFDVEDSRSGSSGSRSRSRSRSQSSEEEVKPKSKSESRSREKTTEKPVEKPASKSDKSDKKQDKRQGRK